MNINTLRHMGCSAERLILEYPEMVQYLLNKHGLELDFWKVKINLPCLIELFDCKPFVVKCEGKDCNNMATRTSIDRLDGHPHYWCNDCNPHQLYGRARIQIIMSYQATLNFLYAQSASEIQYNRLIQQIARAKGLPEKISEKDNQNFFDE